MLTFQPEQRGDAHRTLCALLSIFCILIAAEGCSSSSVAPPVPPSQLITVDCSKSDSSVPQVTYKRGVDHPFDLNNSSSATVNAVTSEVQSGDLNFLNAGLDAFNAAADAQLFTYSPPTLTYSASGNAPLITTFQGLLNNPAITAPKTTVQISGMPYVYNSNADPNYEIVCGAVGNYYPLPSPSSMSEDQAAIENWIDYLNSQYPNAIWIGTQEPSHTLGYSTQWDDGGCSNPPSSGMDAATQTNINRFIAYWTPVALHLHANHIQNGGIQLNSGNSQFYASTATSIMNAGMPLDYFTLQIYRPSATVFQDAYNAYQTFQQNPSYKNVKVIFDRYGIRAANSTTPPDYASASTLITYLQNEALLMPYADMMYGYNVEEGGLEGNATDSSTNLPQVLTWLQKAPAPLRPVSSFTNDLQGFALVQSTAPQKAYIAVWNISADGNAYSNFAINLKGLNSSLTTSNLSILKGSGNSLATISDSGITIKGDTISGISLQANEFLLISLQ